ncbi:hypothetical protein Tco_0270796 [Tanacetum coccineum]
MEPDIENMTLNEYLEYEAKKERRSRKNVRSKRSPTKYEGADFDSFHRDRNKAFDNPNYHKNFKINKYYELPPLYPCFQPAQSYTEARLVSSNKGDEVDIDSMTISEYELYKLSFEEAIDDWFIQGAESLRGMKQEEAKVESCDEGDMMIFGILRSRTLKGLGNYSHLPYIPCLSPTIWCNCLCH